MQAKDTDYESMSSLEKTQANCDGGSITNGATSIKYGDADLSSKRRKSLLTDDCSPYNCHANGFENLSYRHFEQIARNSQLNSSFHTDENAAIPNDDFKGGLIMIDSSLGSALTISKQHASASHNSIVTMKPSSTSKGFENTFKLLQSQVKHNNRKSNEFLQSIKFDASSPAQLFTISEGDEEPPTRLELELCAMQRMQAYVTANNLQKNPHQQWQQVPRWDCLSKSLLHFLYDFASNAEYSSHEELNATDLVLGAHNAKCNDDLIYHAAKGLDGRNCLKVVRNLLQNKVLCGNRVSQMTRAYDDIEAVTRLLEEKEKDLELTVQIGKELLTQNNTLENRIAELEDELKTSNDDRSQLVHELNKKNELIAVLTNDADDGSEADTPTFSKAVTLDLLQKRITSLQDENKSLKHEASQLAFQTDAVEAHERQLMEDITSQLNDANSQFDGISLELERQREENRLQHEQIVNLTARLAEAEMRLHQLTQDNDEHVTLLNITKENQNSLALELVEFKQRYQEVLALLQEAQEQLRKQRKKSMPMARSSFMSNLGMSSSGMLQPESLQSELMESSLYSENSLDSGISGDSQRTHDRIGRLMSQLPGGMSVGINGPAAAALGAGILPPYKRVFETVRYASKSGNYADGCGGGGSSMSMSQLGAMSMSSSSGPRMSAMAYNYGAAIGGGGGVGGSNRNSLYETNSMGVKTLSLESLTSQSDDGYPSQPSGVPGAPGAKDLEAALKRLTPAEVLARRAMLSYAPAGTYSYDDQLPAAAAPLGIRTPDSIMSTGSSGLSGTSVSQWRLPDKLQIVKPIEGSQTLHHWSRLATPTLSGLLEERPGVTIRGGRGLEDLGMQMYTLSDVEEDINDDLPGKQFEASGCTYTYTTSLVMHPDDGIVNDLSFLSQSQMSSRMASASTSRNPSCPPTPHAGLSRKNSCSTFSVNLGLASMLNERGIKAVTPSALNTPAGPNFSPTVTPCNSPEGSPTRSMSPEPLFGILSSGADLIRRKLVGGNIERPNRNQQQQRQQKIMLSRLERRALRSLKLVEKVESIGLENIIASQPNTMSQLASGIANRSSSPMAQLTSLKHLHTSANSVVDDIHFDRDKIKDVLHRGLKSPNTNTAASSSSSAYNSDSDVETIGICDKKSQSSNSKYSSANNVQAKATATATRSAQKFTSVDDVVGTKAAAATTTTTTELRAKQMQRQKSRRNLKNGMATQRPDLGTIGNGGRMRNDLGSVSNASAPIMEKKSERSDRTLNAETAPRAESQSLTQAFVGTVSSLLFGRKGGWL